MNISVQFVFISIYKLSFFNKVNGFDNESVSGSYIFETSDFLQHIFCFHSVDLESVDGLINLSVMSFHTSSSGIL
jgi:hypothetical protein